MLQWLYCIAENVGRRNIGKFTYLDYLEEKTLANSLQMKYKYGKFHKFEGEN